MSTPPAVAMAAPTTDRLGDVFGGLAAMLVALPSAIAFGLLIYAPLGPAIAAQGALLGILGTIAIGLVSPALGGTQRLVSAPCAPAAAVLSSLAATLIAAGPKAVEPELVPLLLSIVALLAGALQVLFGTLGGGRLIKFVPYPVVAGYLSGVGILILIGQIPKLLGLPSDVGLLRGLVSPGAWEGPRVVVGLVAIAAMLVAPRITKAVPAPIIALGSSIVAYFALSVVWPEMRVLAGNHDVIGPIGASIGSVVEATAARFEAAGSLEVATVAHIVVPASTLAVLLSIDTLKTCVIVDALTRTRHNSNRELIGQGLGNIAASLLGGMPGAGTMGATLVNINSGGKTRLSGVLVGVFALAAFVLIGPLVAWVPLSALAGILCVVGFRMVDVNTFRLLRQLSTAFDFVVVAAVVATAVGVGLMQASGVGLGLAILLFLREQFRSNVVRRKLLLGHISSKRRRLPAQRLLLERLGAEAVLFELQGPLFFGTADQLITELDPYLQKCRFVILQMRRVSTVDFTTTHLLEQIEERLAEHGGALVLTELPKSLGSGQNVRAYLEHVGLVQPMKRVQIEASLDDALEWVEDQLLDGRTTVSSVEVPLALDEVELFKGLPTDAHAMLESAVQKRAVKAGDLVFSHGVAGDEVFFIRSGEVKIVLPLASGDTFHIATFGRGDFFGDIAFLDKGIRTADALAETDVTLFVLSRASFDVAAAKYSELGSAVFERLARALAGRLRHTDGELRALQES